MPKTRRRSRTRSAASSAPKQPEPLVLFIGRSLGRHQVAAALKAAGATVRVHDEHFDQSVPDAVSEIRQRANERQAIKEAAVRAVILTTASLSGEEMGQAFVACLRRLERLVARQKPPWIATLTRAGVLKLLENL